MSKRKQFWLGFGLVGVVIVGFFAVAWAGKGFMFAVELFAGLAVLGVVAGLLITGITLMMDSQNRS